jgi:putative endonuclease
MAHHNDTGFIGESIAAAYLKEHEMTVIERNIRYKWGEIDIVAREKRGLVFVEVKCKCVSGSGYERCPLENVTRVKLQRLRRAVSSYIERKKYAGAWRFCVVAVVVDAVGRCVSCEMHECVL